MVTIQYIARPAELFKHPIDGDIWTSIYVYNGDTVSHLVIYNMLCLRKKMVLRFVYLEAVGLEHEAEGLEHKAVVLVDMFLHTVPVWVPW